MRVQSGVSVDIHRSIEDVFILATDHVAAWSSIVVEDEPIDVATDGDVGPRFRTVTQDRGYRMEFEGEVVEYDLPRRSAILPRGSVFDLEVADDLQSLSDGRTPDRPVLGIPRQGDLVDAADGAHAADAKVRHRSHAQRTRPTAALLRVRHAGHAGHAGWCVRGFEGVSGAAALPRIRSVEGASENHGYIGRDGWSRTP